MSLIDESSAANARRTLGGLTLTISNLVALRSLSGPDLMGLVQTMYGGTFQDGLGATYVWNPTDSTPDNGSTIIAPYVGPATGRWNALVATASSDLVLSTGSTTPRSLAARFAEATDIQDYGATTAGSDNSAAIQAAVVAAMVAGNGVVIIPPGTWNHASTLALGVPGLTVIGLGNPVLKFTGTGPCVSVDAGTSAIMYNVKLRDFTINGNATATDGLYVRSFHHCDISNIRVTNVSASALHVVFSVCSKFENFVCSVNEAAFTTTPATGIVLAVRNGGEFVSGCTFVNPIIEGVSGSGITFTGALQNTVIGGTSEGNATGITLGAGCNKNFFTSIDLEANTVSDLACSSNENTFIGVLFASAAPSSGYNAQLLSSAQGNVFVGGTCLLMSVASGALGTVLHGVQLQAAPTAIAYATVWTYGCWLTSGAMIPDQPNFPSGSFTPAVAGAVTAGVNTYTTAIGSYVRMGRLMFVQGYIQLSAKDGAMAGAIHITGLPLAELASSYGTLSVSRVTDISLPAGATQFGLVIDPGLTYAKLLGVPGSGSADNPVLPANFSNDSILTFGGTYIIE